MKYAHAASTLRSSRLCMMRPRYGSERAMKMSSVISLEEARKRLESISNSEYQSEQTQQSDQTGVEHIDEEEIAGVIMAVYELLSRARVKPFTTKSDLARVAADVVALCASEGLLTTSLPDGHFTNIWMITPAGMEWLEGFIDATGHRH